MFFCFYQRVFGGPDNFSFDAHLTHALGGHQRRVCGADFSVPDIRYRLTRTLGRVLGLGWVAGGCKRDHTKSCSVADDFEGFPVMHFSIPVGCVAVSICYPMRRFRRWMIRGRSRVCKSSGSDEGQNSRQRRLHRRERKRPRNRCRE